MKKNNFPFINVISEKDKSLNSSVSIQSIEGIFGLIMESRSGTKGTLGERNTDYFSALETILNRLKAIGINFIKIYIVSSRALNIWDQNERQIQIDGNRRISLENRDVCELRKKISKAQQEKKEDFKTKGGNPTKKILISVDQDIDWKSIVLGLSEQEVLLEKYAAESQVDEFSSENAEKEKILRSVSLRRGQQKFRKQLLIAYENQCAVTHTMFPEILEAAHIVAYKGVNTNHITNGLLLRADIHTLFDLGLIGINDNYEVIVSSKLIKTEYELYNGKMIKLPINKNEQPSLDALASRLLPIRY